MVGVIYLLLRVSLPWMDEWRRAPRGMAVWSRWTCARTSGAHTARWRLHLTRAQVARPTTT